MSRTRRKALRGYDKEFTSKMERGLVALPISWNKNGEFDSDCWTRRAKRFAKKQVRRRERAQSKSLARNYGADS